MTSSTFASELSRNIPKEQALILWFEEVGIADIPLVGGKNASLGEMILQLKPKGVNVPNGFATTAYAFRHFIKKAGLESKLRALFVDLDVEDMHNLRDRGRQARALVLNTPFPNDLHLAIAMSYQKLCDCDKCGKDSDVAVRSSATAEDLPDASFAGQQETYLNVYGANEVVEACHRCFASLFTDRAISYRTINGFDHFDVALSVGVQKMVRSDLASSGVMFSIDTETGFKNAALITAAYGLGENVVQGAVNPDEYFVFKPTLKQGFRPILEKRLGTKEIKMVYDLGGGKLTKNIPVSASERGLHEEVRVLEDGEHTQVDRERHDQVAFADGVDAAGLGRQALRDPVVEADRGEQQRQRLDAPPAVEEERRQGEKAGGCPRVPVTDQKKPDQHQRKEEKDERVRIEKHREIGLTS